MKIIEKLLLILIMLVAFDVLINFVNTMGLAVIASEVKPLISDVDAKLDSFEMPDFSVINELVVKAEPLLDLLKEVNTPSFKHYFKEFMNFTSRLDDIDAANLVIPALPGWSSFYANRSCE